MLIPASTTSPLGNST